jgi:hypothetical protein
LRAGASSSSPKIGRGSAGSHACRITGAGGGAGGTGVVSSSAIAAIRTKGWGRSHARVEGLGRVRGPQSNSSIFITS